MDTSVARKTNIPDFATAYYLLEGLNEIGIDYLFCNFGTDHAPIIDEMAHRRRRGEPTPAIVRCPHENTAAHMAAGYALVTGRGQGVLVHVDVGTANTANGMHKGLTKTICVFQELFGVLLLFVSHLDFGGALKRFDDPLEINSLKAIEQRTNRVVGLEISLVEQRAVTEVAG